MSELTQADRYLLEQIRQGEPPGWSQLIERYQGRLLAFAQSRLAQRADAEDIVQETFLAFLKVLKNFREQASLETFLFTILRHKIVDRYRAKNTKDVSLLQDIYPKRENDSGSSDAFSKIAGREETASWYARRDELHDQQHKVLSDALAELVKGLRDSLNFRDLEIVELLFFCQLPNKDIAQITNLKPKNIAVIKHRSLKQLRERIEQTSYAIVVSSPIFENLLTEVWKNQRLSCPKRSTIGGFLLGTLDSPWHEYVDFHLNKLGCHFCRANLEDLRQQNTANEQNNLRQRILESTVGFLHKS